MHDRISLTSVLVVEAGDPLVKLALALTVLVVPILQRIRRRWHVEVPMLPLSPHLDQSGRASLHELERVEEEEEE